MSYIALARRYRPQTFAEVVGQPQVTETLRQAISGGRIAPAYLFTGPRGSGKTTVARIVAKAVNCDSPKDGEPCGRCEPCVSIAESRSLDVLEIDGASNNSVDDVRELRENVGYAASRPGKRKVYIVDEVHMLSQGAFNALLKTLEEPPAHVMFVFATTEPRKVPSTVVSRCQRFDFRRLQTDEIRDRLGFIGKKEKLDIDPAAVFLLAKRADGSLRDGLSLLDQVVSSASGRIDSSQVTALLGLVPVEAYLQITRAVLDRDARTALATLHGVLGQGADASDFALGLVEHLRNLLLLGIDGALQSSVQLSDANLAEAQELAARFRTEDLLYLLNRSASLYDEIRRSPQPVVGLEAAIVEMTRFESRVVLGEVLERLEGGPGPAGPRPPAAGGGTRGAAVTPARGGTAGRRGTSSRTRAEAEGDISAGGDSASGTMLASSPEGRGAATIGFDAARATSPGADDAAPSPSGADGGADVGRSSETAPFTVTPPPSRVPSSPAVPDRMAARAGFAAGGPPPGPPAREPVAAGGSVATASLDLDQVLRRWDEFTLELRATKAFLSVCLAEGKPVRLASGILEIWFPPEHAFHLHAIEDAIRQRELDPYLEVFFGQRLKLALAADEVPAGPVTTARLTPDDIARSRRGAIEDVVQNTPAIDDIIRAFDGEVLEDQDG